MSVLPAFSTAVPLVLVVMLASCSTGRERAERNPDVNRLPGGEKAKTFVYQCAGDFEFTAQAAGDSLWLFLPRRTVELRRTAAGSGTRYTDGDTTFWSKGGKGWFTGLEGEYEECQNDRSKAIWEHAKLGGVDYRAVGTEPGWHVEIRPESIVYVGDYGNVQYTFARPEPQVYQEERTTFYETAADGVTFNIRIRARECRDTMSGEEFATEATIWVNGREYRGCGKALH